MSLVRGRRGVAVMVTAVSTVLLMAACSGSGGTPAKNGGSPSGGPSGGPNAFADYTQCLQKNGVTLPSVNASRRPRPSGGSRPSGGPRRSGQPRPSGAPNAPGRPGGRGFTKPDGVDDATWQKAQQACASLRPSFGPGNGRRRANAAYENCLKDHGVDAKALNSADPKTVAALETCKVLNPAPAASTP